MSIDEVYNATGFDSDSYEITNTSYWGDQ